MQIWLHNSMNQQTEHSFGVTLNDWKWQDFLSRMQHSFQYEHILAHGWKDIGNMVRGGKAREKRRPGIGTDYLMAMSCVKEFCNQSGVAAYKAASSKTADLICKYTQI